MFFRHILTAAALFLFGCLTVRAQEPPAPPDFPRFTFDGHQPEADVLSDYLWYHFIHRGGEGLTLFDKEYLTYSDMWCGGAVPSFAKTPIQEVHRDTLLKIEIDDEGYINTHQHFSHAHDEGWPFPLWAQSDRDEAHVKGKTAGWHFQPLDQVKGWVKGYLANWKDPQWYGEDAAKAWELQGAASKGIVNNLWEVASTAASPLLLTPAGVTIDAFNAPYIQLRWKRSTTPKPGVDAYLEWERADDAEFGPDRRMLFPAAVPGPDGLIHSLLPMYRHPLWKGPIKRLRLSLAPGEDGATFDIDSFFTVYDTRQANNNPIYILANYWYFNWSGDVSLLRENITKMRRALRYFQSEMGALQYNHIRNTWPGHDGLPGFVVQPDGKKIIQSGHGMGENYWDLLPFGWDDFYATYQYYAATLAMAEIEDAVRAHPDWNVPLGEAALDPAMLRDHAAKVKTEANKVFWNPATGRFNAAIDQQGQSHDYGFTFANLDAIWYGIADDAHAGSIVEWLTGKRNVDGDTSTGADIYKWRFGPRSTTRRNIDWYGFAWYAPESVPWGGQVQDGGGVLGFSFYDLWARLQVLGPDDAWARLMEIVAWQQDVTKAGSYRAFYADGKQGTTMQGGNTAGGIGIDNEFYESSLLPSIVTCGFIGLRPHPDHLEITPRLPKACPSLGVKNVLYQGVTMDVTVDAKKIEVDLKTPPQRPLRIMLSPQWKEDGNAAAKGMFVLDHAGTFKFTM